MQKRHTSDVAIIGGGSAGICAAIAAARKGAKVTLMERSGKLGGMGTLAKVHTFCGLYHPDTSRPPAIANQGLPAEIESIMRVRTGAGPIRMGKVYVLPQDPDTFAKMAHELVAAEPGITLLHDTTCTGITRHSDGTFTVGCDTSEVITRSIVDTSADAAVAPQLGATRHICEPEVNQRSAYIFSLRNVSPAALKENFRMRLALAIVHAVKANRLPPKALGTASRASTKAGEVYFTTDLDPASPESLTEAGHGIAATLTLFLKSNFPEYENATGPFLATHPGIRETYRWEGQYILTEEDLVEGIEFPDTVAFATWPIELRENTRGPRFTYFKNPVPANIPLRALTSSEIPDVFFAGRCLSATHRALASLRVMGTCFATGQAAGIAAAEAAGI